MDKLDILKAAKDLTGENNIDQLISIAARIEQYLTGTQPEPVKNHPLLTTIQKDVTDFAPTVALRHPTRGAIPFTLYDFQRDALHQLQYSSANTIAIASARQMGWTNIIATYMLHYALTKDNTNQLLLSPRFTCSTETAERIRFMVDCRPDIQLTKATKTELEFGNGSRIYFRAASPTTVCGLTIHKAVIMDAAYVSHKTLRDVLVALAPAVATGGQLIMQSTPNVAEDPFHQFCKTAGLYINQPWHLHPDRGLAWHAEQVSNLGQYRFAKEYEAQFISEAD